MATQSNLLDDMEAPSSQVGNLPLLAPYRPTAYEMKYTVCRYLLYKKSYAYAFTEWHNNGDVVALTKAMYATEVEIKISLADFRSELKAIRGDRSGGSWSKVTKHEKYLDESKRRSYDTIPKYFYFCVPDYLEEMALAALQELPYGLLVARFRESASMQEYDLWWHVEEVKKARQLGNHKVEPVTLTDCLQKAQHELLNYRRKIAMLAGATTQGNDLRLDDPEATTTATNTSPKPHHHKEG